MTPGPPGEALNEPKQTNGMDERDEQKTATKKAGNTRLNGAPRRNTPAAAALTAARIYSRRLRRGRRLWLVIAKRQRAMTSVSFQSLHVVVFTPIIYDRMISMCRWGRSLILQGH